MNMYAYQDTLPPLPLPELEDSSKELLEWSAVFLSEKELLQTKDAIHQFSDPSAVGPLLQEKLAEMAANPAVTNWLEPFWTDFYLSNPSPLPTGGNVTFLLDKNSRVKDLPLPEFLTSLILHVFQFHQQILEESLDVDFQGKNPLCMTQYKTLLGTSRIPGEQRDYHLTDPKAGHVMIFRQGRYYRLQVKKESGELLPASLLLKTITAILNDPKPADQPLLPGVLTSLPRREWAALRNSLMALGSDNKSNLHQIESALAVFAIDETPPADETDFFSRVFCSDPANRWYDKSLQFVLNPRGDVGINYEHSGVDGTTLGKLVGYLFDGMEPPHRTPLPENGEGREEGRESIVREMSFRLDSSLEEAIRKADGLHQKMGQGLSFQTLAFTDFGKDTIKGMGVSPDSFIQLGIQLAQYKAFQKVSNAYESVMTKQFRFGRTETMRPVTWESLAFVTNPSQETLKAASLKHVERINMCKRGYGVDRHFFAMKKMHERLLPDSPLPEVFQSPGYKAITRNTFSTSTSSSHGMRFAGYGPSVDDGYAVRYLIYNDRLHFVLSSYEENSDSLVQYKDSLQQSYLDMANL